MPPATAPTPAPTAAPTGPPTIAPVTAPVVAPAATPSCACEAIGSIVKPVRANPKINLPFMFSSRLMPQCQKRFERFGVPAPLKNLATRTKLLKNSLQGGGGG